MMGLVLLTWFLDNACAVTCQEAQEVAQQQEQQRPESSTVNDGSVSTEWPAQEVRHSLRLGSCHALLLT